MIAFPQASLSFLPWIGLIVGITTLVAESVRSEHLFFPLDNGLTDLASPQAQAALLKELGYDGLCSRPQNANEELFAALDQHGLKLIASYVTLGINGPDPQVPKWLEDHIEKLRGRDTMIWLSLTSREAEEKDAVALLQKVNDLAVANDLKVVLYPHAGFYTDTVATCVRLREKAGRPELGLSFTLCHFLKQNSHSGLEATIRSIAPHLKLVQINGANRGTVTGGQGWEDVIKPLGEGDFDMMRVFKTLDQIGYKGPINLQCYSLKQPARQHLHASMQAWKQLRERMGQDAPHP